VRISLLARSPRLRTASGSTLSDALLSFGHEVAHVDDRTFVPGDEDVALLAGSLNWYPEACRRLRGTPRPERPRTVLWHTEPLPLPAAAGLPLERLHAREVVKILLRDPRRVDPRSNFRTLRRMLREGVPDVVVVSTLERQEFLAEHGVASDFAPMGYHPTFGTDLGLQRDIDVLFLGSLDVPRRRRIIRALRHAGVNVVARGSWDDPELFGEGRVRLLNRTKILLNVPRHPGLLSGQRMILGMANKALVVAEPVYAPGPYVPGVHYVSAALEDFPETIGRFLADDAARQAIVDAAYELVTSELTLSASVETILRACFRE